MEKQMTTMYLNKEHKDRALKSGMTLNYVWEMGFAKLFNSKDTDGEMEKLDEKYDKLAGRFHQINNERLAAQEEINQLKTVVLKLQEGIK